MEPVIEETAMKMLLALLMLICSPAVAQNIPAPLSFITTASTNCTLVEKGAVQYMSGLFINTTAALAFLKIYDSSVTPSANLTPLRRIPIPFGATSSGAAIVDNPPGGLAFPNGLGFCVTGAFADNDATNSAAGIAINFSLH
jgi:hypothetical protein